LKQQFRPSLDLEGISQRPHRIGPTLMQAQGDWFPTGHIGGAYSQIVAVGGKVFAWKSRVWKWSFGTASFCSSFQVTMQSTHKMYCRVMIGQIC